MKKLFLLYITLFFSGQFTYAQELAPYIKVSDINESIETISNKINTSLKNGGFTILGNYIPANNANLKVIVFTRNDLKEKVVKVTDRGALAAAFKIGLYKNKGTVTVSYTNPEYILRAYLRDNYINFADTFEKFNKDLKTALTGIGNEFKPFGGSIKADKLKNYHYKIMMPYFSDPITLNEFTSFEEGIKTIENNLKQKTGKTTLVYKIVYPNNKVAVFGIGLEDEEEGEAHFLPKIGEAHVAALPYEIILQNKKATMLHGKYRIALHWPDLTMGTFMKIMSTPGDIEDALKQVCK